MSTMMMGLDGHGCGGLMLGRRGDDDVMMGCLMMMRMKRMVRVHDVD